MISQYIAKPLDQLPSSWLPWGEWGTSWSWSVGSPGKSIAQSYGRTLNPDISARTSKLVAISTFHSESTVEILCNWGHPELRTPGHLFQLGHPIYVVSMACTKDTCLFRTLSIEVTYYSAQTCKKSWKGGSSFLTSRVCLAESKLAQ